jgi:DNA repair exonuclease SbcCD ATPase subunit
MRPPKRVDFLSLKIEGFFSIIEPMEYRLDSPGMNLLQGENGAGKTTILSALPWALFGVDLKGRKNPEPWEAIKGKDYRGTLVSLELRVEGEDYTIHRTHKYSGKVMGSKGGSRVVIVKGTDSDDSHRDKKDFNKAIIELIGMDYTIMCNSLVFGQDLKTLVEESGAKRKALFDEFFRVGYINTAKEKALSKKRELETELNTKNAALTKLEYQLELKKMERGNYKDLLKSYRAQRSSLRKDLKEAEGHISNLERLTKELREVELSLDLMGEVSKSVELLEASLRTEERKALTAHLKATQLKGDIEDYREQIQQTTHTSTHKKHKICPECGQEIKNDKSHEQKLGEKRKAIKQKLADAKEKLALAEAERAEGDKKAGEFKSQLSKYREKVEKKNTLALKVRELETSVKIASLWVDRATTLNSKLRKLEKPKKPDFRKAIKQIKEAIGALDLQPLKDELKDLEWIIGTALSNSGIKSYIFSELLKAVNERLEHYAGYIGLEPRFIVNLGSARKDIDLLLTRFGNEIKYDDLSGGQKQLVNTICLFAIHDIFSESVNCNIMIVDEVFKFLDVSNTEIVSEILKMKAPEKSKHVITHNHDLLISRAKIVRVELTESGRTAVV